jgi:hypothetical protein
MHTFMRTSEPNGADGMGGLNREGYQHLTYALFAIHACMDMIVRGIV